jgi:hypothetical protein
MLKVIKNFILVILSIIFSIIVFEIFLHFNNKFASPDQTKWAEDSDYPLNYFDQPLEFGSGSHPGVYKAHKVTSKGVDVFDVEYHIGSDGFRVTEETSALKRANFFGGSNTFGEALQSRETLPHYFQSFSPDYNVKNFGFHGYGVHEALAILESNHDTKGNINFLLTAPWHAERMRCINGESSSSKPVYRINRDNVLIREGNCASVIRNYNDYMRIKFEKEYPLLDSVSKSKFSNIAVLIKNIIKLETYSIRDDEIELYIKVIEKISSLSKNRGQVFIVGYIKSEKNYLRDTKFSNSIIMDRIRETGAYVIDMTLSDDQESLPDKYVVHPEYEGHPSAIANFERAKLLSDFIKKISIFVN